MEPEAKARIKIDKQLEEAGWVLQDYQDRNIFASLGVAVREFPTANDGEVDYALFVDGEPVGILEAKRENEGENLASKAHEQNIAYAKAGLKGNFDTKPRFVFESTGVITEFVDLFDPDYRTRTIYQVFQPKHLQYLIQSFDTYGKTLRGRLMDFDSFSSDLIEKIFRKCQINAIRNLEKSFGEHRQRALVQMATGAGKTFTAITSTYRILKSAKAKRVLFLVDTNNLGEQAEMEFKNYQPYDSDKKFTDLYKVTRLQSSYISDDTTVCITTIQRLYNMLSHQLEEFAEESDEEFIPTKGKRDIEYNPDYPPEYFDFIIIDECHRSIYNQWRGVVEYFDAFLIGLTATPSEQTIAFFQKNIVSEYTHEQAVRDGVNVAVDSTFVIETEISKKGGVVAKIDNQYRCRDRRTRKQRFVDADGDIEYTPSDLDNAVVNPSEIQLVLETLRDNWKTWSIFNGREEMPKTLIFAKNDSHADDIVRICREVFGKGNEFCKKITFKSDESDTQLLYDFRHKYDLRIAVTVTKIATGTDVKPIEILVFMRDIKSENFYEQMLGRARRSYSMEDLQETSPSAKTPKLGYVVVDAVGVTKSKKTQTTSTPNKTTPFKVLIENVLNGDTSDETLTTLATRLDRLSKVLTPKESEDFEKLADEPLVKLADDLAKVHNPDELEQDCIAENKDYSNLTEEERKTVQKKVIKERAKKAVAPLHKKEVRDFLYKIRNSDEQTIDPTLDKLLYAGVTTDVEASKETIRSSFKEFIEQNRDSIEALSIIYSQSFKVKHLTEQMIHDLFDAMRKHNATLVAERIFSAYSDFTKSKSPFKQMIDIVQIVRYEYGLTKTPIIPFGDNVRKRYQEWMFEKNKNKQGERGAGSQPFTPKQMQWLEMIRDHIAMNGCIEPNSFYLGSFAEKGGALTFFADFGNEKGMAIIDELNELLVA